MMAAGSRTATSTGGKCFGLCVGRQPWACQGVARLHACTCMNRRAPSIRGQSERPHALHVWCERRMLAAAGSAPILEALLGPCFAEGLPSEPSHSHCSSALSYCPLEMLQHGIFRCLLPGGALLQHVLVLDLQVRALCKVAGLQEPKKVDG